jgi:hypothetical protein
MVNSTPKLSKIFQTGSFLTIIYMGVVLLFLFQTPALGEFYKYRDANGVLRFTDNLAEVPPDQRPNVSRYQQVEDFQAPTDRLSAEPTPETEQEESGGSQEESDAAQIAARYRELNQKKAALDKEYTELVAAQQSLAQERQSADTNEEKKAVNQKVQGLNERIAAFEQKRAAFEQEVQAFNKSQQE